MRIVTALLTLTAFLLLTGCQSGFSPADIEKIKEKIRADYAKEAKFEVIDLVLMRETPTRLTGFIKLRHKLIGEMTKSCSATMAEDNRNIIWQCGVR